MHTDYVESVNDGGRSTTDVTEDTFPTDRFDPVHFAVGLRVRDIVKSVADKRNGARPVWFYGPSDKSWACVMFRDGAETVVWQGGPRHLWDEVEAAFRWWADNGRPAHDRFGLTVTENGQRVWLDAPDNSWAIC